MSLIEFNLRQICRSAMDSFLPRGSGEERALLVTFNANARVYLDYNELTDACREQCDAAEEDDGVYESITEGSSRIHVNLLLVRPANYTRVLMQIAVNSAPLNLRPGVYQEKGYHDSCWDECFTTLDQLLREQGSLLALKLNANLKPEFQNAPRVDYDTNLDTIALKTIRAEQMETERQWKIEIVGDAFDCSPKRA